MIYRTRTSFKSFLFSLATSYISFFFTYKINIFYIHGFIFLSYELARDEITAINKQSL
jgi:hypothetical protein